MTSACFQGKPFNITVIQVCAPTSNAEEAKRDDSTHGRHQMVNTEIRLTILFAVKDGKALNSQPKQDRELIVLQIMNSLSQNSDFI